jgi:signal transduction histidine kinase
MSEFGAVVPAAADRDERPDVPVKQIHSLERSVVRELRPLASMLRHGIRAQEAAVVGVFLVAYLALEWASFMHEQNGLPVTPWNPGLGIAFGLMVLKGPAYGLALFGGVVLAEILVLQTELDWPVVLGIGLVVSASYAAAADVARRYLRLDAGLARLRDLVMLLAAGVAGAAVAAALLIVLLMLSGQLGVGELTRAAAPLFVGDIIGIAVMTPVLLRLARHWPEIHSKPQLPVALEIVVYVLVTGFALWMILAARDPSGYTFFYLLFLPVVAAGVRHGIDGACLGLLVTQFGLVGLLHWYGYDARQFTEFQAMMLVLTMTGLLVGVVVSERRRADSSARELEARLKALQAEAARAARMNMVSGMASALAHEIAQPMTAARALARSAQQLLRTSGPDMARVDENLATMVVQIDHAGSVVRRMREFLRRGQPHVSTLDIGTVLHEALALARPEAEANRAPIELHVPDSLPAVFGDRVQLQQVVLNLLRNAVEAVVEARRPDGHIRLGVLSNNDGHIEISVADNGVGVPPDHQIFEPLSTSKADGLGLGLSICASIVQAHGGRIWLQSSRPGATEFRFSLPIRAHETS